MIKHKFIRVSLMLLTFFPASIFAQQKLSVTPAPATQPFDPVVSFQAIEGGYAVVVSKSTLADAGWERVVETLKEKYGDQVKVIVWNKSIEEAKAELAGMMPHYTCFVATPAEASREFVEQVHRLTRNLNDDPYPDTVWGILTGLNSSDALRIARTSEPLVIQNVVSTTGVNSGSYQSVFTVSDGNDGAIFKKGQSTDNLNTPPTAQLDRAHLVVDAIHDVKPDMFVTSAHAGEWRLEMPFSHGVFVGRNGQVVGVPTSGPHGKVKLDDHGWELISPNPKVWLAAGNCLIGHIDGNDSMALAMMHSAGVTQMVGYTVTTWYGVGGWGTLSRFQDNPGRYSLAESFFINDLAITRRLAKQFPGVERYVVQAYKDSDSDLDAMSKEIGKPYPQDEKTQTDLLGLTWDHDTVAFYGDPAWRATVAGIPENFTQRIVPEKNGFSFEVSALKDGDVDAFTFLQPIENMEHRHIEGDCVDSVLTNRYIEVDFGPMKKGETRSISISGIVNSPSSPQTLNNRG